MNLLLFRYKGPIMIFEKIASEDFEAYTYASSAAKAKSNFIYQAKCFLGRAENSKLTLPGTISQVYATRTLPGDPLHNYENSTQLHF